MDLYERLDSYFEMFKNSKKLNIKEAKELAKEIKKTDNQIKRNCLYEELLELYAGVESGQYSQSEMIDVELRICIFSLAIINRDVLFKKGAKTR